MLGAGLHGFLALSACLALGCGGTETSGSHSSDGGTDNGSAGGSNIGGAGGTNADAVAKLFSSAGLLCERIAACYPDLQTADTSVCTAPASGGRKVVYQNPAVSEEAKALFDKCVGEYSGPKAEIDAWVQCQVDTVAGTVGCYDDCPADAEPCSVAGNMALEVCHALPAQAELRACTQANK